MSTTATATDGPSRPEDDTDDYPAFLAALRARFEASTATSHTLFTTTATGLFDVFLDALPPELRAQYRCSACRHFVDRFGALVTIDEAGQTAPAMWDASTAPPRFEASVRAVARLVARAAVDGVFLATEATWGVPESRPKNSDRVWRHMAVAPSPKVVFRPPVTLSAGQVMAEKREDFRMLGRGLAEFPIELVRQAHTALSTGALYRSEKCVGVARWLLDLHEARVAVRGPAVDHVTWRAVATAPAGFCHVRSSMIGTLLEDLAAGMPFSEVKRRFDEKMHPLQYLRPTAAPSDGNIAQAEKVVEALRASGSLGRRFARLDDLETVWRPKPAVTEEKPAAGVFGHLRGGGGAAKAASRGIELPTVTMTWVKFAAEVLPAAESMDFEVPAGKASFGTYVTAANPEAPPLLQWDRDDRRNPVSHYVYTGGSLAANWNLAAGSRRAVTAVSLQPSMWFGGGSAHHGAGVLFVLDGARDVHHQVSGGFFPEDLRSEYHGVRKTMEAHAKSAAILGKEEASAAGILLQKGNGTWAHATFRVTSRGATVVYRLDRWD